MKIFEKVRKQNFFSNCFETKPINLGSYFITISLVLLTCVLSTSSVDARDRVSFTEVVVYDGKPTDYSNRTDVIFIDDSSSHNSFSNTKVVQDFTNNNSSQPKVLAKRTKPSSQSLTNVSPAKKARVAITKNTKVKQINPPKVKTFKVKSMDIIAKNEIRAKNKKLMENIDGKDPQLVAFYMDVFGKQTHIAAKQTIEAPNLLAKQTLIKSIVRKKAKSNKAQLLMITSKGKDPELVAFYKHVFGKKIRKPVQHVDDVIVVSKVKNPDLVAFYKQVFGKNTRNVQVSSAANIVNNKVDVANNLRSKQKRRMNNNKRKTLMPKRIASVEMQKLIDGLTNSKIL